MQNDARFSEFPEDAFPCRPEDRAAYLASIANGLGRMGRSSVVICGLVRSAFGVLPRTIARIERLGRMFQSYRVVAVENDSCDGTPLAMRNWEACNANVELITLNLGAPHYPQVRTSDRTHYLAALRNRYLERLRDFQPDFVIVVDFDLEIGWSYDGVASSFGHDHWDGVGSNSLVFRTTRALDGRVVSRQHFYDSWAFRLVGQEGEHEGRRVNAMRFGRGDSLLRCWSCFGGLALYRFEAVQGVRYAGGDCEHVLFHAAMRDRGFGSLFMNPSQITMYNECEPTISCISIIDGIAESDLRASVVDFARQTYRTRELILVSASAGDSLARSVEVLSPIAGTSVRGVAGRCLPDGLNAAIQSASGSVVCQWDARRRHHSSRLAVQFDEMTLGYSSLIRISGSLVYVPERHEIYWVDFDPVRSGRSILEDVEEVRVSTRSLMGYRHAAARYSSDACADDEVMTRVSELRVQDVRFGGGWLSLSVWPVDRLNEARELACSADLLLENRTFLESAMRDFGLCGEIRVMSSRGEAFLFSGESRRASD